MDNISVAVLSKVETVSALKVLLHISNSQCALSVTDIATSLNMPPSIVRTSLVELHGSGAIIATASEEPSRRFYKIVEGGSPLGEWKRVTASKKKKSESEKDFLPYDINNLNFYTEDINIRAKINPSIYEDRKILNKISRDIIVNFFLPKLEEPKFDSRWFSYQTKTVSDMLLEWRPEQIMAAIEYWCNRMPINSLKFLLYNYRRGETNMMVALDHYKKVYLSEYAPAEAAKKLRQAQESRAEEARRKAEQEKEKSSSISDEEFLKSLFSKGHGGD